MATVNSSKKIIDNFKRSRPATATLIQFLPFAAAFMACVDGEVQESEIRKINDLGKKFLGKKFSNKALMQAVKDVSRLLANFDESIFKNGKFLRSRHFLK